MQGRGSSGGEHLLGKQEVACSTRPLGSNPSLDERMAGVQEALSRAGLGPRNAGVYEAMEHLRQHGPYGGPARPAPTLTAEHAIKAEGSRSMERRYFWHRVALRAGAGCTWLGTVGRWGAMQKQEAA